MARGYIYLIQCGEYYKIGKTLNPNSRVRKYITENPEEIKVVCMDEVERYDEVEKELHEDFKNQWFRGEWFKLDKDQVRDIDTFLYTSSVLCQERQRLANTLRNQFDYFVIPREEIRRAAKDKTRKEVEEMYGIAALVDVMLTDFIDKDRSERLWRDIQDNENLLPTREEINYIKKKAKKL